MSRPPAHSLRALLLAASALLGCAPLEAAEHPVVIVIHGGAGVIERAHMTPEREASFRTGLGAALDAGYAVLERGGSALDAVGTAVRTMEDDPQFNAGKGAVLNHDGICELDAAIMDGTAGRAGAVAELHHVKNPIDLARLVMEKSPHVMLAGQGAEEFALAQGVVLVPESYCITPERMRELEEEKRSADAREPTAPLPMRPSAPKGMGTVGAVALDAQGHLAAATSTGGLTNKLYGRIGDTPIIGAGTYADESCAVSGTGQGEFYIRQVVAYDICAMMQYQHVSLSRAVDTMIHGKLKRTGGEGGVIALDRDGNIAMDFNSAGMHRGVRDSRGRREIAMYRDTN
ncbi:MAG TPA: isoaspartyl peptidase/L-asparaginase [Steroidobacteraceae bacterium]|jgi:beta-aspartyl-peptidase (threonine type)|nr:isoaspartyl peptidase/L-asparaginase [Steroidobacteraceae bacterium]